MLIQKDRIGVDLDRVAVGIDHPLGVVEVRLDPVGRILDNGLYMA